MRKAPTKAGARPKNLGKKNQFEAGLSREITEFWVLNHTARLCRTHSDDARLPFFHVRRRTLVDRNPFSPRTWRTQKSEVPEQAEKPKEFFPLIPQKFDDL
jgi:hypothetical protein